MGFKHSEATLEGMRNRIWSAEALENKIRAAKRAGEGNRVPVIIVDIKTHEK